MSSGRMCASCLIFFYHVLHPVARGVWGGGCECADGVHDDHSAGVHDDDDVSWPVSLSVGDQPLVDRTLRGVHCTPHTARQQKHVIG